MSKGSATATNVSTPPVSKKSSRSAKTATDASMPSALKESGKNVKSNPGAQMDHIAAAVYFLDWAKATLELYTKSIKKLFLIPLTEHCVRRKAINATISNDDQEENTIRGIEAELKLEEGVKVDDSDDEIKQLQRKLQLSKNDVANASSEYVPVIKEKWISLAENSALYRLGTLVKMSGSLLVYMVQVKSWIEKHKTVFSQYGRECNNVLDYAVQCFEAICVQSEIFSLDPIDRSKVRSDFSKFISLKDPHAGKKDRKRGLPLQFSERGLNDEIKLLEAQINFYRTSVFKVGNSLTDITQAIPKKMPCEVLEVTTKEVKTIMVQLPPAYRDHDCREMQFKYPHPK